MRRHDLAYVKPAGWGAVLGARGDLAGEPLVAQWADEGRPLIARRVVPGEGRGVALGLPLPRSAGKRRLAFLVPAEDILSVLPPPLLAVAGHAAPASWRATLDRLNALASTHGLAVRVYGSLAWAALTGLDYLGDGSDIDLLMAVGGDADLGGLTADLAAIEAEAPMRLDGEFVRADGGAVNWREFQHGARQVLVKNVDAVGLVDAAAFLSAGVAA